MPPTDTVQSPALMSTACACPIAAIVMTPTLPSLLNVFIASPLSSLFLVCTPVIDVPQAFAISVPRTAQREKEK
uniref:Uncharacterized protein n=1 Tax=uncultured beta proteobacterium HF0010_04H24 TaxID=710818 RepID=E0XWP7_9PROT|nr:hypothetical protein [uncultured beta proteobacterium HF0010_04H24]